MEPLDRGEEFPRFREEKIWPPWFLDSSVLIHFFLQSSSFLSSTRPLCLCIGMCVGTLDGDQHTDSSLSPSLTISSIFKCLRVELSLSPLSSKAIGL